MPTNLYEDSKFSRLSFELYRGASSSSYVSNIKITTASPDVRNKLLSDGDRLVTEAAGETKPVAPNDTPANKALNRRVEFIKL